MPRLTNDTRDGGAKFRRAACYALVQVTKTDNTRHNSTHFCRTHFQFHSAILAYAAIEARQNTSLLTFWRVFRDPSQNPNLRRSCVPGFLMITILVHSRVSAPPFAGSVPPVSPWFYHRRGDTAVTIPRSKMPLSSKETATSLPASSHRFSALHFEKNFYKMH
jgi:hypothetical protein